MFSWAFLCLNESGMLLLKMECMRLLYCTVWKCDVDLDVMKVKFVCIDLNVVYSGLEMCVYGDYYFEMNKLKDELIIINRLRNDLVFRTSFV